MFLTFGFVQSDTFYKLGNVQTFTIFIPLECVDVSTIKHTLLYSIKARYDILYASRSYIFYTKGKPSF